MVSPFRYDEGETININGERIAPGLLTIEEQKVERSVATEDAQRIKSWQQKNVTCLTEYDSFSFFFLHRCHECK